MQEGQPRWGSFPVPSCSRSWACPRSFSSTLWQAHVGLPWWRPFLVFCYRRKKASPGVGLRRDCKSRSTPCTSFNNGTMLLWQSVFPPQIFSIKAQFTPLPSDYLLAASNSPFYRFAFQSPHSSMQHFMHNGRHISQAGVCRVVEWTICVGPTLSCVPQTCCFTLL